MLKKSGFALAALLLSTLALTATPVKGAKSPQNRVTCNCQTNKQCGTGHACCILPGRSCGICC